MIMENVNEIKITGDDLYDLVGKKIAFKRPKFYCNKYDWYDFNDDTNEVENLPDYMEVRGQDIYFKANVPIIVGEPKYTPWPTLGEDEIDFAFESGSSFKVIIQD